MSVQGAWKARRSWQVLEVREVARRAKAASRRLSTLSEAQRNGVLERMAQGIGEARESLFAANQEGKRLGFVRHDLVRRDGAAEFVDRGIFDVAGRTDNDGHIA